MDLATQGKCVYRTKKIKTIETHVCVKAFTYIHIQAFTYIHTAVNITNIIPCIIIISSRLMFGNQIGKKRTEATHNT